MKNILQILIAVILLVPSLSLAAINCASPQGLRLKIDNAAAVSAKLTRGTRVLESIPSAQIASFKTDDSGISLQANNADGSAKLLEFKAAANAAGFIYGVLHYRHSTIAFTCVSK
jgi:hypothetical protein